MEKKFLFGSLVVVGLLVMSVLASATVWVFDPEKGGFVKLSGSDDSTKLREKTVVNGLEVEREVEVETEHGVTTTTVRIESHPEDRDQDEFEFELGDDKGGLREDDDDFGRHDDDDDDRMEDRGLELEFEHGVAVLKPHGGDDGNRGRG